MTNIVEVRFDCEPLQLTPAQVQGILEKFDPVLDIDLGLGYGGKAAATFDVPEAPEPQDTTRLAEEVAQAARDLGLTVTGVEILSKEEYEERAWSEVEVDPNG